VALFTVELSIYFISFFRQFNLLVNLIMCVCEREICFDLHVVVNQNVGLLHYRFS
jgi:hypothetical protein